jgi:translocation and assembly module TamB
LPFASARPDSDRINLQTNLQNENLALLNLFTDAVTWVDGRGQVNIEVGGTLKQPMIMGTASVENAIFKAQALGQPLTNVTGKLEFNGDRIVVEGIQARYNRDRITAEGVLPIFNTEQAQQLAADNPLTVSFKDLNVNLQELYQGGVSGDVIVRGTAISTDLSGEIRLMNGEILIGATETDPGISDTETETPTANLPIEFSDLQLILDNNLRVTNQPLLSFEAEGDLAINGTLDDPRPVGEVSLIGGQINLFTTQFTLDPGYENTARFTPKGGLDPILNVNLIATVPEIAGGVSTIPATAPDEFLSSEIREIRPTGFSSIGTVRVEALAQGRASELEENLKLTSDPPRSETEIISLLGESFVNAFNIGQVDPASGIVAVGGATIFNYLQQNFLQENFGELYRAIGLSEFRLFPTIVTDPNEDVSVLGLAAEAVFNVINDFSVSVSYVIATDEPLRYNLIYRLSDDVRLRGSTNFVGENRALVEYETRF